MKISELEGGDQLATKLDLELLRTEMHKEFTSITRWWVTILAIQSTVILGTVYFLLGDIKADLRDVRTKVTQQQHQ